MNRPRSQVYLPTRRSEWQALYKTARWKRLREHQLAKEPLCRFCLLTEEVTEARVVDHIKPHKGDILLFHDPSNLQSLCKHCHDTIKLRIEHGHKVVLTGVDGYPVDVT